MEVNDWDLFAVVRGCGFFGVEPSITAARTEPFSSLACRDVKQEASCDLKKEKLFSFPGFVRTEASLGETEEPRKLFTLDTPQPQPKLEQKRATQTPRPTKRRYLLLILHCHVNIYTCLFDDDF
jgi:hypothetical protein